MGNGLNLYFILKLTDVKSAAKPHSFLWNTQLTGNSAFFPPPDCYQLWHLLAKTDQNIFHIQPRTLHQICLFFYCLNTIDPLFLCFLCSEGKGEVGHRQTQKVYGWWLIVLISWWESWTCIYIKGFQWPLLCQAGGSLFISLSVH